MTPNQHALARQFGLYDNTYDIGTNSAEGHNWLMQADDPEYTESSAGEYLRSYDTEDDALGHQRTGFLWTGAQAAGKTVRDFGEFHQFLTKPADATWQNLYCDAKNMAATGQDTAYPMVSSSPIPSLNNVSVPGFPKFDTSVPDIYRYEIWKRDFEKNGPANLNMFWLSSDHTGGPPNAAAQVADNDLAVGKIVDTISHSQYWKDSAIFVVEDDSQAGLDHVDGHRAPIQIISPYARHGVVDSHYYSQITMIRTIEQILGIHPMNQKDSAASPMRAAFTQQPDFTPFTALPNRTSLTLGLATAAVLRRGRPGAGRTPPPRPRRPATVPADQQAGRGAVGRLEVAAAADRARRQARLRQPGADEPLHLVPDARLDEAVPRREQDLRARTRAGRLHPVVGHRLRQAIEQAAPGRRHRRPGAAFLAMAPRGVLSMRGAGLGHLAPAVVDSQRVPLDQFIENCLRHEPGLQCQAHRTLMNATVAMIAANAALTMESRARGRDVAVTNACAREPGRVRSISI